MHHLSAPQWFVLFSVVGLLVFLATVGPEVRRCPSSLQQPSFWFWCTVYAGLLGAIIPYVLLHVMGAL